MLGSGDEAINYKIARAGALLGGDVPAETDVMAVMAVGFVIRAALFPRKINCLLLSMRASEFYMRTEVLYARAQVLYARIKI